MQTAFLDSRTFRLVAKRRVFAATTVCLLAATVVALGANGPGTTSGAATTAPERAFVPYGAPIKAAVDPVGQASDGTVTVSGVQRTYRLYVPASLPHNAPVPLLVALHGGLGSGQQFEQQSGFDGLAEANHFIVVYPNGTAIRPGSNEFVWNAGSCCSVADQNHENVNDVGFISALITQLETHYDIDKNRVFATGHSNGAMLAERLACQLSDQIVAIAVQSGTLTIDRCEPAKPVAALEIHGTADLNVPINGGVGSDALTQEDYPPPVDVLKLLAARDKCAPVPTTRTDSANSAVNFEIWHPCAEAGTVVEWAKVTGANHAWMGHPASPAAERLDGGAPYMGFDSSAAVWSFLAAHPRF
jgi:polyhydroxybutyrate depolymerase